MPLYNKILKNIKSIRNEAGISQEYLAHEIQMDPGNYNKIENGKQIMKLTHLVKIASVLKCDITYFFTYPDKYIPIDKNTIENNIKATIEIELTKQDIVELGLEKRMREKLIIKPKKKQML
jgi:transcriptional regulator with XRE-family HTH domain